MNEVRELAPLLFGINLIMMLAIMLVIGGAPIITRKSLLFGVRIPEKAAKDVKTVKLKKNYIRLMVIGGATALVILIVQYLLWPDISLLTMLYLPLLLMAFQFVVYISSWRKSVQLKAENSWVVPMTTTVDTASAVQREKILDFPKGWYVISTLIILAIIVISAVKYASLPAQIPANWGIDMKPNVWGDKNFWTVFLMPIISIILVSAMMLGNISIYRMKLQVSAEHPELSYSQHRIYRRMMSTAVGIMTLMMTIFLGAFQLMTVNVFIPSTAVMVVIVVMMLIASCVPFTYVYFKAGQGGCKLVPIIATVDAKEGDKASKIRAKFNRGDDKYWKLGLFYYNQDDPAMLIEDRFGTNSGFNYARTASKVVTALLIIITVMVYIGTTIMFIVSW